MGSALGVVITTDVPMSGQHAQPVYVDDSLPIVGPSRAIVVTNGEVPQTGGPALAVRLAPAGTPAIGPALPVYVVSGSLSSGPAASPPVNSVLPSISGTANIGYTLSSSTGSWTNSPSSYTYQWKRAGVNIGGATASTYVVTETDSGSAITVEVTATNAGGSTTATSASVTPPSFLLLDRFTTNRAAGAVNGTAAEPGGSLAPNRTVVDGSSLLSIASSQLTLGSGGAANNPNLVYTQSTARAAGKTLAAKCGNGNAATFITGWSSTSNGTTNTHRQNWNNSLLREATGFPNVAPALHNSPYWYMESLRATGCFFMLLGADFAYPTLLHIDRLVSSTPLYPSWSLAGVTNGGNMIVDDMAIPTNAIYPTALASDDYARADGAPGSTNSYDGGTSKAYTDRLGTSAIASNALGFSALSGGSEGLITIDSGILDHVTIVSCTRAGGIVGIVGRWADASNYVRVQHDGTNLQIIKVVAGTPTTVATAAVAFSAGADLEAIWERTTVRAIYNNTQLAANASTIADAGLQTGAHVGLYSTNTGNAFDNFSVWPRGTNNEYAAQQQACVLKQAKPCIVFDGDSLTIGSTVTVAQSYPYVLIDSLGRAAYDSYNVAITGQLCADLLTDRTYSYGPLASAGIWSKFIVDLWIGSNDLVAGRTAAAIYADITTLVQYYQSLGALVAVNTIIPRTGIGGANETARLALNVLINANSIGANAVIDLAANANLQDFNNTTYFNADKTHLTATGYGVVASVQQPIIGAL